MLKPIALVAGLVLSGGVAHATPADNWITTKIKLALLTGDEVHATTVHVDTLNGQVTIHGKVQSSVEKDHAETIARAVDGVRNLRNLLQVVPERDQKLVEGDDARIDKSVSQVLKEEPSLKDVSVKSVDKGVVLLAGKSDNLGDYLLAVECARAVPGVRRVFSEVQRPEGSLEWKEARVSGHNDSYLTAATKLRLISDSKVSVLDVSVDTKHGRVTLFGIVPSRMARTAAEADAHKVDGVVGVENQLQVVPVAQQKEVKADDKAIRSSIESAFKYQEVEHVDVGVENRAVRLTGTVPTIWKQLKAATLARSVAGVRSVNDEIHVSE